MTELATEHPYPRVAFVLNAIADWISRYRKARAGHDDFARCDPEDVTRIAHELGVTPDELASLASKGPNSAALLEKMLVALGVDAEAHQHVAVWHDLQRLCMSCGERERCKHEFDIGGAAEHFRQYCPNAYTLDALLTEKGIKRLDNRGR